MTAELPGSVSTSSNAFAKALVAATRDHGSRRRTLRIPAPCVYGRRRERGFTLTELMVAIGIVAVLSAVGLPLLVDLTATQRVKTATFDFYAALSYARSEAIKRNAVVTIAPRSGGFAKGWDIRQGGTVLRSALGSSGVAFSTPAGVTLAYGQDGRLTTSSRYQTKLTATSNANIPMRCVIVDPSGRPAIRIDANRDGNCING